MSIGTLPLITTIMRSAGYRHAKLAAVKKSFSCMCAIV
jgi:hypothetical protein